MYFKFNLVPSLQLRTGERKFRWQSLCMLEYTKSISTPNILNCYCVLDIMIWAWYGSTHFITYGMPGCVTFVVEGTEAQGLKILAHSGEKQYGFEKVV